MVEVASRVSGGWIGVLEIGIGGNGLNVWRKKLSSHCTQNKFKSLIKELNLKDL